MSLIIIVPNFNILLKNIKILIEIVVNLNLSNSSNFLIKFHLIYFKKLKRVLSKFTIKLTVIISSSINL